MPEITFHNLRHTRASQLINAGVDVVTISKRLGHRSPKITLGVYTLLYSNNDERAAQAVNDTLLNGSNSVATWVFVSPLFSIQIAQYLDFVARSGRVRFLNAYQTHRHDRRDAPEERGDFACH